MPRTRIRCSSLWNRITSPEAAANLIQDGMVVGMSGFTKAGDAKELPLAMARRAAHSPFQITLVTGASLGHNSDNILAEANILARRLPFQSDDLLRREINAGRVMFVDQHLSETVENLRAGQLGKMDIAIIEAVAITENGGIVPSTSIGNTACFAGQAEKIIVEINTAHSAALEGTHDVYVPAPRPGRAPIPIVDAHGRIGTNYIPVDPAKIAAIVVTHKPDSPARARAPEPETNAIAAHLIDFLKFEVRRGRMDKSLLPLQAGIGVIANSVLSGLMDSPFENMTMYSEVLQDSTFELLDCGKLVYASGSSITLSQEWADKVFRNIDQYRDRVILRPQEISNHPEVIRRLGVIAINTALEFDIYGNVNSTHVNGTHMMNGIGGSGDFARNAYLSIFVAKSVAKHRAISSVVPMVPHVDHHEHDVDVVVTDQGLADLRGLAPRERAAKIIANCAHPDFRDDLLDYYDRAQHHAGGHCPHLLDEALSWHARAVSSKTMKIPARLCAVA